MTESQPGRWIVPSRTKGGCRRVTRPQRWLITSGSGWGRGGTARWRQRASVVRPHARRPLASERALALRGLAFHAWVWEGGDPVAPHHSAPLGDKRERACVKMRGASWYEVQATLGCALGPDGRATIERSRRAQAGTQFDPNCRQTRSPKLVLVVFGAAAHLWRCVYSMCVRIRVSWLHCMDKTVFMHRRCA